MIFGDIEPDSISLEPRNEKVWEAAAPRVLDGSLKAIFIECSYTDDVDDGSLYGHLCPRHLIAELEVLASKILDLQKPHYSNNAESRKRKRTSSGYSPAQPGVEPLSPKSTTSPKHGHGEQEAQETPHSNDRGILPEHTHGPGMRRRSSSPRSDQSGASEHHTGSAQQSRHNSGPPLPLQDLHIFIIHVKDKLNDNETIREQIIDELNQHKKEAGLGCEFYAPISGEHVYI